MDFAGSLWTLFACFGQLFGFDLCLAQFQKAFLFLLYYNATILLFVLSSVICTFFVIQTQFLPFSGSYCRFRLFSRVSSNSS